VLRNTPLIVLSQFPLPPQQITDAAQCQRAAVAGTHTHGGAVNRRYTFLLVIYKSYHHATGRVIVAEMPSLARADCAI
jgi:hypothetical protein